MDDATEPQACLVVILEGKMRLYLCLETRRRQLSLTNKRRGCTVAGEAKVQLFSNLQEPCMGEKHDPSMIWDHIHFIPYGYRLTTLGYVLAR